MSAVETTKKTIKRIEKALKDNNIKHEQINYDVFLFNASGYSIYTDNCTIEVCKNIIAVNEKQVKGMDEMINEVLAVEGYGRTQ
ncbi:hypothetical protein ABE137_07370 [Brevibacillus laterosporus]|uniref:hypothetical protein n=1 Tax=Brevibacillus laterosporus TaxID=1465 RepID=UPI003D2611FF